MASTLGAAFAAADIGFALATIGEGVWKYSDINKGVFDDDKKYNVIEGVICNVMGDKAGSVFFNLASIGVSGLSIKGNIKNLNKLTSLSGLEVKAILTSINNHTDTFTIAGSTYKLIYEIKTNN